VLESPLFEKKDYTTALVESFMQLDRELIEGNNCE
jgi:hypothetical protein